MDLSDNFEEFHLMDSLEEEELKMETPRAAPAPTTPVRCQGDGAASTSASASGMHLLPQLGDQTPTPAPFDRFLDASGLTTKSILTPSRLLSNHKNMLKPKDVKHRSRVRQVGSPGHTPCRARQSRSPPWQPHLLVILTLPLRGSVLVDWATARTSARPASRSSPSSLPHRQIFIGTHPLPCGLCPVDGATAVARTPRCRAPQQSRRVDAGTRVTLPGEESQLPFLIRPPVTLASNPQFHF